MTMNMISLVSTLPQYVTYGPFAFGNAPYYLGGESNPILNAAGTPAPVTVGNMGGSNFSLGGTAPQSSAAVGVSLNITPTSVSWVCVCVCDS